MPHHSKAGSGPDSDWAYEVAKDIRVKWMRAAFVDSSDFALPAGHLTDIAEALRTAHATGERLAREAAERRSALTTGVGAEKAELAEQIRRLFGRAIEEDGRLCDAADAVDDLCDQVVDRVHAAFADLTTGAAR